MGISSDVYISKEEAIIDVKEYLMLQHEQLVDKAIEAMSDGELCSILSDDLYYYNIRREDEDGET